MFTPKAMKYMSAYCRNKEVYFHGCSSVYSLEFINEVANRLNKLLTFCALGIF